MGELVPHVLSVKQYVLLDPALAPLADMFVWLAIDSEKPVNAPFLRRFVTRNWPTLRVIEPATETPTLKWIGAATAAELHDVLADALRHREAVAQPDAPASSAAAAVAEADTEWQRGARASASGDAAQAIEHFRRVVAVAPASWARRPQVIEALSMRLAETDRNAAVVELARREASALPAGTARLNVVLNAVDAASELPADAPERKALPELIALGTRVAEDSGGAVLLDDRSSLYLSLVNALKANDPVAAKALATRWSGLLDAQAARETDAAKRRVWDPHRVDAYLAIGGPARAIPMLEQSEREQPSD